MTLQQLRYLCAVVNEGFSVSRAANVLGTSQPGISKQIRALETELGADLLIRRSNRMLGLTAAGESIIEAARRTLWEAENLQRITNEFTQKGTGRLVIATTHMYARYVLRGVITDFVQSHPDVELVIRQGMPSMIGQWVAAGDADIGISGKVLESPDELLHLPFGSLDRSVFAPAKHPILRERKLTLKALTQYPMITMDIGTEAEKKVTQAFQSAKLKPSIVLRAIDADVVKSYVDDGLGIAILLSVAYEPERDRNVRILKAAHLFEPTIPQLILRQGKYLSSYMHEFINKVAPQWDRQAIDAAVKSKAKDV